jgi:electron transfer flavoprotein alpha subunit
MSDGWCSGARADWSPKSTPSPTLIVATLEPGVRGVEPRGLTAAKTTSALDLKIAVTERDAEVVEVLPPDPATMDLAEAARIVAGGAGIGGPDAFVTLRRGPGRVPRNQPGGRRRRLGPPGPFHRHDGRQRDAKLYIALGISGAVQHTSGLGDPEHIVAVNTDASAPMMAMADLAIVTDARALLDELAARLGLNA